MSTASKQDKKGIALVGLGKYSTGQLAPALEITEHCYLAGIVTGSPEKAGEWKKKYHIADKNIYNYENFDEISDNPDIRVVYVVLPNSMHEEYVVRAAKAGKHVICEKPMAITAAECDRMIKACKDAGVLLSVGYRLHFEPHNQEVMRLGNEKEYGALKKITAWHSLGEVEGWRLDAKLAGGGPLVDVGIYCVQAARYITGMEPLAVTAQEGPKTRPEMFRGIEESITWTMEFPDNIVADCGCSYTEKKNMVRVEAEKGWFALEPAFSYKGIRGETSEGKMDLPEVNQQARQMDDFIMCIRTQKSSPVAGEMAKQDARILTAIYEAARTGERVEI